MAIANGRLPTVWLCLRMAPCGHGDIHDSYGQLGIGNRNGQLNPVQVAVGKKFVAIAAGIYHSLALSDDGTLWTWGY